MGAPPTPRGLSTCSGKPWQDAQSVCSRLVAATFRSDLPSAARPTPPSADGKYGAHVWGLGAKRNLKNTAVSSAFLARWMPSQA